MAFFSGQLVDTHTVFVERAAAPTAVAAGKPVGPTAGGGRLEQLTPAQAADRLQALLPAGANKQPQGQQQRPVAQQAQQQRRPAQQPPAAQQPAPQREAAEEASGQQLASLVGGQSPENLDALRRALQQLGVALDEQAVAGGQLPSTEVRTRTAGPH